MVRLTDRPDMTLDAYCGCKTTMQHATIFIWISTFNGKLLISQSQFFGTRKFTLREQKFRMNFDIELSSKVGKKAGNTHISQDGGKYW